MPQDTKIVAAIDAVLARLPADSDTYRIRHHVAELRNLAESIRPKTKGGTDAGINSKAR